MNIAAETRRVLSALGEADIAQVAEAVGADRKAVGQAMMAGDWAERISRGRYRYLNGSQPEKVTTPAELQPLVDSLSDEHFDEIGLKFVARTRDGGFICVDDNGLAWKVEVVVTARLI